MMTEPEKREWEGEIHTYMYKWILYLNDRVTYTMNYVVLRKTYKRSTVCDPIRNLYQNKWQKKFNSELRYTIYKEVQKFLINFTVKIIDVL